ncbi:uncharacterized protein LOC114935107 [Nylanderia fulva]|uniref:uncharacterized protein LOC114935107 n=1 Tax=Nylanderia fulva TaxID=613905 RepID=UPI0010FAE384|nr:uncharacterized protein LOC114935107 [Nylanderia fulva]
MKGKCKESEDFNRDFVNLLHKHRIPLDRFPIHNEEEDIRQEENNREVYVRKRKMEKYQEELTKAKMVRQNMKRNYWEDRNKKKIRAIKTNQCLPYFYGMQEDLRHINLIMQLIVVELRF